MEENQSSTATLLGVRPRGTIAREVGVRACTCAYDFAGCEESSTGGNARLACQRLDSVKVVRNNFRSQ